MEPLWQLLNPKAKDDEWNGKHKAGLRSAAAGRQFTQARVKLCGWSYHDRCLVCLNELVESETPFVGSKERTVRDPIEATSEQIERAPVGDLAHRLWIGGGIGECHLCSGTPRSTGILPQQFAAEISGL